MLHKPSCQVRVGAKKRTERNHRKSPCPEVHMLTIETQRLKKYKVHMLAIETQTV